MKPEKVVKRFLKLEAKLALLNKRITKVVKAISKSKPVKGL
jgi:hypothetical protein